MRTRHALSSRSPLEDSKEAARGQVECHHKAKTNRHYAIPTDLHRTRHSPLCAWLGVHGLWSRHAGLPTTWRCGGFSAHSVSSAARRRPTRPPAAASRVWAARGHPGGEGWRVSERDMLLRPLQCVVFSVSSLLAAILPCCALRGSVSRMERNTGAHLHSPPSPSPPHIYAAPCLSAHSSSAAPTNPPSLRLPLSTLLLLLLPDPSTSFCLAPQRPRAREASCATQCKSST